MMAKLLVILIPGLIWVTLLSRITALRKSRYGDDGFFANAGRYALLPHQVFDRDSYTPRGQRLLPWLKATGIVLVASMFVFLWLLTA